MQVCVSPPSLAYISSHESAHILTQVLYVGPGDLHDVAFSHTKEVVQLTRPVIIPDGVNAVGHCGYEVVYYTDVPPPTLAPTTSPTPSPTRVPTVAVGPTPSSPSSAARKMSFTRLAVFLATSAMFFPWM